MKEMFDYFLVEPNLQSTLLNHSWSDVQQFVTLQGNAGIKGEVGEKVSLKLLKLACTRLALFLVKWAHGDYRHLFIKLTIIAFDFSIGSSLHFLIEYFAFLNT